MSEPRRSLPEIVQGTVVLVVMLCGLGWLVVAAVRSDSVWFKATLAAFLVPVLLWVAFIAWMAACQWLDKRRCAREGRAWRP
jgi:hypothetical protein